MDSATKQWVKASEAWLKETELTIIGDSAEKQMLQTQCIINKKRIALLNEQISFLRKSKSVVKRKIAKAKKGK